MDTPSTESFGLLELLGWSPFVGMGRLGIVFVSICLYGCGVALSSCLATVQGDAGVFGGSCGKLTARSLRNTFAGTRFKQHEGIRLRGGGLKSKQQILDPKIIAGIQFGGLALQVWGWFKGHVKTVTIVGPALPVAGRLPVTLNLPPPPNENQVKDSAPAEFSNRSA